MVPEQSPALEVVDMPINMGPQHPSTHGVFRMVLVVNGEKIVDVVPHIGYMHRGGEKLMEAMDFRQGIGYCDRTEYLAQFSAELAYCLAVERLMDIQVPERAEYIRVILTEMNRLSSHFMFVGAFGIDFRSFTILSESLGALFCTFDEGFVFVIDLAAQVDKKVFAFRSPGRGNEELLFVSKYSVNP